MRIADIEGCSIIPGRSAFRYRRVADEGGQAAVTGEPPEQERLILRPAAIVDGYIDMGVLETDPSFRPPADGPFTQAGDIIQETMTPFAAAYVGSGEEGVFVPNSCCVIRLQGAALDLYDPLFVVGFLNLDQTNEALRQRAGGPRSASLRKGTVEGIDLPDVPLDEQRKIGRLVGAHIAQQRARRSLQLLEKDIILASYAAAQESEER